MALFDYQMIDITCQLLWTQSFTANGHTFHRVRTNSVVYGVVGYATNCSVDPSHAGLRTLTVPCALYGDTGEAGHSPTCRGCSYYVEAGDLAYWAQRGVGSGAHVVVTSTSTPTYVLGSPTSSTVTYSPPQWRSMGNVGVYAKSGVNYWVTNDSPIELSDGRMMWRLVDFARIFEDRDECWVQIGLGQWTSLNLASPLSAVGVHTVSDFPFPVFVEAGNDAYWARREQANHVPTEEECRSPACKRMKDLNKPCWWCGVT